MDPAGLIGIGVALSAIFGAMILEGAQPMSIMLPAPLLLVWLGTLGVGVAGHTLRDVKNAFAAVPRALLDAGSDTAAQRWAQHLLARWPARVAGPRVRRMYASLARTRLQARAQGSEPKVTPLRTLLRTWWAGRG